MFRILAGGACVALVFIVIVVFAGSRITSARRNRVFDPTIRLTCVSCNGRGWLVDQQRSLDFQDGAFVDRPAPPRMCPDCQGTGVIVR